MDPDNTPIDIGTPPAYGTMPLVSSISGRSTTLPAGPARGCVIQASAIVRATAARIPA